MRKIGASKIKQVENFGGLLATIKCDDFHHLKANMNKPLQTGVTKG
jgi:hypothetical protein